MYNGIAMHRRGSAAAHGMLLVLALGTLCTSAAGAQSDPAKPGADAPPEPSGFSIETEMFTYRALESNSEAIACDIAGYLNGAVDVFKNPPQGSVCNVNAGSSAATVILLPFATSEFQDFQIWRADMATMTRLHDKARMDCPSVAAGSDKGGVSAITSKLSSALVGASPAGPPLAVAQGVLALMASGVATSSVGGTIHDQAFMDGVGRQLQELNVPVLMPTAYTPFSLVALDEAGSPFLGSLNRILDDRGKCLEDSASHESSKPKAAKPESNKVEPNKAEPIKLSAPQSIVVDIDAYLNTLTSDALLAPKDSGAAAQPKNPGAAQPASSSSHLSAVLLADGLATKLGVDAKTGSLDPEARASIHVLLIQALESGGSVTRHSNVFGTKIQYSGGSVGTYALFTLDGDLECSGNVYEYGESKIANSVSEGLVGYKPDPAKQMIFLRHSCKRLSQKR